MGRHPKPFTIGDITPYSDAPASRPGMIELLKIDGRAARINLIGWSARALDWAFFGVMQGHTVM